MVAEEVLACKNFDFLKTRKWLHTGRNSLYRQGDRSQQIFCGGRTWFTSSL